MIMFQTMLTIKNPISRQGDTISSGRSRVQTSNSIWVTRSSCWSKRSHVRSRSDKTPKARRSIRRGAVYNMMKKYI